MTATTNWAFSPFRGHAVATLIGRAAGQPGFRNDATTRCTEPVNSLRKAVFLASLLLPPVSRGHRSPLDGCKGQCSYRAAELRVRKAIVGAAVGRSGADHDARVFGD